MSTQSKVKLRNRIFEVWRKRKIPDLVRNLIMDLTAAGVSLNSMIKVIQLVGEAMGFEIRGYFARLAVNQIVEEGDVAAEMQLMYKAQGTGSESSLQAHCTVSDKQLIASRHHNQLG
jgi:hypothetical protein